MRKLLFMSACIIVTVFLMNCITTGPQRMIKNSNGYDYTVQTEENRQKINRPEWVEDFNNWQRKNEGNGTMLYFMGSSIPIMDALEKQGKNYWTEEDATNQAWQDAMRQVTGYIQVEIKSDYQERINELSRQGGTEQNGMTVAQLRQYQSEEEILLDFQANSYTTVDGLRPEIKFSETWERTFIENNKQRIITAVNCWIIFSISIEDINRARQRISDERQTLINERMRRESLENREVEAYISISREYNNVIADLNNPDISTNEILFGERYNVLLYISARLKTLTTLETRNDTTGVNYRKLLQNIEQDVRTYNPNDRQGRLIQDLQAQIRDRDIRLDELRSERRDEIIAGSQGYNLQTQTFIISFPQKPYETRVTDVNILAAKEMVSNLDYISFANINGITNFLRAENGLYTPVISVSWNDAARYCNWLSKLYGLTPCYEEYGGRITAYSNRNNGYRLPEEHEIIAMLGSESEIINETEFISKGIWSSTGFPQDFRAYKLFGGTGSVVDRLRRQSFDGATTDIEIGFRVVRNAN